MYLGRYLVLPDWAILESFWQQIVLSKQPKYFLTFWAAFKKVIFYEKIALVTLMATIGNFGLLLIPASGHTGPRLLSYEALLPVTLSGQFCEAMNVERRNKII